MVPLTQVQAGIARYIDTEFVNKISGWQKWVVGAGAALYLQDFTAIVSKVKEKDYVKVLNIIDSNDHVDVDRLYKLFKAQAQKGPVTFNAPILGAVTLNEGDVDRLYSCIMQGG